MSDEKQVLGLDDCIGKTIQSVGRGRGDDYWCVLFTDGSNVAMESRNVDYDATTEIRSCEFDTGRVSHFTTKLAWRDESEAMKRSALHAAEFSKTSLGSEDPGASNDAPQDVDGVLDSTEWEPFTENELREANYLTVAVLEMKLKERPYFNIEALAPELFHELLSRLMMVKRGQVCMALSGEQLG